jgi:hypothetical protein
MNPPGMAKALIVLSRTPKNSKCSLAPGSAATSFSPIQLRYAVTSGSST